MMKIVYINHSGFYVETKEAGFLFDYYKGTLPESRKKLYVFVSHAHYDHYNKKIFDLRAVYPDITYILSSDICGGDESEEPNLIYVKPNETLKINDIKIRTLRSTDEGVAFLVHCGDKTIYHAGDLNWWHWEGESREYNTEMRRSYQSEINKLQGIKIDAAFVPVDPRLGEQYCFGMDCFMKRTDTKHVFPMHFWGNYEVFKRLMLEKCTQEYRDRIIHIRQENQVFLLEN